MSEKIPQSEIQQNCYIMSDCFDIDLLLSKLGGTYNIELGPINKQNLVYYDTFDWRLYRQDKGLVIRQQGQKQKLELESLSTGSLLAVAPPVNSLDAITGDDLAPSALRESILPIIDIRALLPVITIALDSQKLVLRDKHDKIVVRLTIERNGNTWIGRQQKQPLSARIKLIPIKGYQRQLGKVNTLLLHTKGLTACQISLLDAALQASGRQASDYSSKLKIKLKPDSQSAQAVKDILQYLLIAMEKNESGMLAGLDTEFLHDYRVAIRRMRSLISQMKGVLPETEYKFLKTELAWLGTLTTPARDLDVYLLEFGSLQDRLPVELHDALLPFREFVLQQQLQAYRDLSEGIATRRYKIFKQAMHKLFESKIDPTAGVAPNANKAIHAEADTRIWRCYRRVMKEAQQLTPDSPAEEFHELRKSCKKLRYLLEFFQGLYPGKDISQLISQLKILQDNLGEFQDMDVQSHTLRDFARQMAEQGVNNAETFMAMGVLADGMEQRKRQLQHDFIACYKIFSKEKYRRLFKALFKPQRSTEQVTVHESVSEL